MSFSRQLVVGHPRTGFTLLISVIAEMTRHAHHTIPIPGGIELGYIRLTRPDQNALIARFSRTHREEVFGADMLADLHNVRRITRDRLRSYNEERPHDALGSLPPALYREQLLMAKNSTSGLST